MRFRFWKRVLAVLWTACFIIPCIHAVSNDIFLSFLGGDVWKIGELLTGPKASEVVQTLERITRDSHGTHHNSLRGTVGEIADALCYLAQPDQHLPWNRTVSVHEALLAAARFSGGDELWFAASQGERGKAPRQVSASFPGLGMVCFRSGWPMGEETLDAGHAILHGGSRAGAVNQLDLYAFGRPLLVARTATDRLGSAARINGLPFSTGPDEGIMRFESGRLADYAASLSSNETGFRHERRIAFLRPDTWLVFDRFSGTGPAEIEILWTFASPEIRFVKRDGSYRTLHRTGGNLLLRPVHPPETMESSPRENHTDLRVRYQTDLPFVAVTELRAYEGTFAPQVWVEPVSLADSHGTGILVEEGRKRDLVLCGWEMSPNVLVVPRLAVTTCATFALVRWEYPDLPPSTLLLDCTRLLLPNTPPRSWNEPELFIETTYVPLGGFSGG